MSHFIDIHDPDTGGYLGQVEVCDAHNEATCLTFGPCAEPRGYDGFGAPIYDHQEDDMPTDLPPGFTGTGKQDKDIRPTNLETGEPQKASAGEIAGGIFAWILAMVVGIPFVLALSGALTYLGLYCWTHLP